MFLVEKTNLTSHFKLTAKKKPSPVLSYQLAARSFDEKVISHLKTLDPVDLRPLASDPSVLSLSWMSKAVTFLSTVHGEAHEQISNLRSEPDPVQDLYMEYSQKVLDLANLISSAVQKLTERRLLLNLSLRLLKPNSNSSSGQIPAPEKLKKAKDSLIRSVHQTQQISKEKAQRAKDLIEELTNGVNSLQILQIGKISNSRDLIRRTLYGLGALTVFITGVLVSVLYGQFHDSDLVEAVKVVEFTGVRVPAEFLFADSVNGVRSQVLDLIKPKQGSDGGDGAIRLSEIEDAAKRAVVVCDVIDEVIVVGGGGGDGGGERLVRFDGGVKELGEAVGRLSDGVDELTNGVNGLFSRVLKTRNGVLDGVRKGEW